MGREPAACLWEVVRGPGSGALSHTLSSSAPSLPAGHTPELMFLAQKVTLSLHACCVFISHLRRERDGNLEQFLNRLCPFVVAAPVDSCCPGVGASPGVGKCPVT